MSKIIVHTDGGARGNPGPAAIGVVIDGFPAGQITIGEKIGETTNNEAEYRAMIRALEEIKKQKDSVDSIECFADSELMVEQLNGRYKVKNTNIREFVLTINKLIGEINVPVSISYVPRAKNAHADELVNQALDMV